MWWKTDELGNLAQALKGVLPDKRSEDWAIEAPARNRAAPAEARPKGGYAASANPTLSVYHPRRKGFLTPFGTVPVHTKLRKNGSFHDLPESGDC